MQLMCALHLVMNLIMSETLIPCLHHSLVLLCDLFLEFQQRVSRLLPTFWRKFQLPSSETRGQEREVFKLCRQAVPKAHRKGRRG